METLSLVLVAAATATAIGVPLGTAAAHRPGFYALLRPILDLMQTLPTFVYLIPTLVLFGASQRRRLLVDAALRIGRRTSWDYQPVFDVSRQYVRNDKTLEELEGAARFPRLARS